MRIVWRADVILSVFNHGGYAGLAAVGSCARGNASPSTWPVWPSCRRGRMRLLVYGVLKIRITYVFSIVASPIEAYRRLRDKNVVPESSDVSQLLRETLARVYDRIVTEK